MSPYKILLTGATGYIGGSILDHLMKSDNPAIRDASISTLIRGPERASKLTARYGKRVNPVFFKDLDDTDRIIEVASEHDIVIGTTAGSPTSGVAIIRGLAKRKQATGKDTFFIHTSGISNLADFPLSGKAEPDREFDDVTTNVYGWEKAADEAVSYGQRTAELAVVDAGLETGVKTLVIMSGLIYGSGTGLFHTSSIQIPMLTRAALSFGKVPVMGEGTGVWDSVCIEDLSELYELALYNMLEKDGADLPFGKTGIIFSGSGRYQWKELSQNIAHALYAAGKIDSKELRHMSLDEVQAEMGLSVQMAEQGLASNAKTVASVAKRLGWKPKTGSEAWQESFVQEVKAATG